MVRGLIVGVSVCLVSLAGCAEAEKTSTHHALIRYMPAEIPGEASAEQFTAMKDAAAKEYAEILQLVDAWAARSGLRRVPDDQTGQMRLRWMTTAANGNEQTIYYVEERASGADGVPIEVLVAADPDSGGTTIEVSMGEGFGKEPSPQLQALHDSLAGELTGRYAERVRTSIW